MSSYSFKDNSVYIELPFNDIIMNKYDELYLVKDGEHGVEYKNADKLS
jgi:hypothetical protein